MSIRLVILYISIIGLSVYAWKDWFKSLCGLIVLMAIIEHEDMPKNMFEIQGLNPWNVLFSVIFIAWLVNRSREGLRWDMPRHISVLVIIYLGVIVFGVLRAIFDRSYIEDYPVKGLISEELINTIKWILPGILLYDGARTRKRVIMALVCLLVLFFLISLQVAKHVPPSAVFSDSGNIMRARRRINNMVGYGATDMSVMLGGACWGLLAALPLIGKKFYKIVVFTGVGLIAYSQALTGGRAGYVAWGAAGLIMCLIKWRKYLLLTPVIIIILPVIFPGAVNRMLQGFGQTNTSGQASVDEEAVLSGRMLVWPYVIDKISESPLIGYGRLAMKRTGLYDTIEADHPGTGAPHPHNLYLETLLDNGLVGSLPIWIFWIIVVINSARLFRKSNKLCAAVGGLSLSLTLTSLIAGLSGQHWFPMEHTLGIWAALFLSLRMYVEEQKVQIVTVNNSSDSYDTEISPYKLERIICNQS